MSGSSNSASDYSQCLPGTGDATSATATTFSTATKTGGSGTVTSAPVDSTNPLKGKNFYANPYYASEISSLASPSLVAAGSAALAAKATNVAKVGTFYWL